MLKSVEMKQKLEAMIAKMKVLNDEGNTKEAHDMLAQCKEMEKSIEIQEMIENQTTEDAYQAFKPITNKTNISVNEVFNKLVLQRPVTADEMKVYEDATGQQEGNDAKGGYLVPKQQFEQILELKRQLIDLKSLCTVTPVYTKSGTMPVESENKGKLVKFSELNDINQSDFDFSQLSYDVEDYGDLAPMSNTLLKDTNINLVNYIGVRFARKAVRTENEKIVTILKTAEKTDAKKGIPDLQKAINGLDPEFWKGSVVITNQDGFDWLDGQVDKTGRNYLQPMTTDATKLMFKGRRVIVLSNAELPNDSGKAPFFIGDVKSAVAFFDREGVEVAVSTEAGFKQNTTMLRAIERFDVKALDLTAVKYITVDTATVPPKA